MDGWVGMYIYADFVMMMGIYNCGVDAKPRKERKRKWRKINGVGGKPPAKNQLKPAIHNTVHKEPAKDGEEGSGDDENNPR
jgi:hypothetical protein